MISNEIPMPTQTIQDLEIVATGESDNELFNAVQEQPFEIDIFHDASEYLTDAIKQNEESRKDTPVVTSSVKRSAEDTLECNEEIDSKKRNIVSESAECENTPQTSTGFNNKQLSLVKRKLEGVAKHDEITDQHTSESLYGDFGHSPGFGESNTKESVNNNKSVDDTRSSTTIKTTFGEPVKVKIPGVERRKITTGEESEEVICQRKGSLTTFI
ncbi:hypothetical protein K501DRAFT_267295 [Backusella circina FSU 941]|nr:hypothetical protein K501DRAFT_267295 [Backusella circina FSU 941]